MKLKVQIKNSRIFIPLLNKWESENPKEKMIQQHICKLVNDYGFGLEQMEQQIKINDCSPLTPDSAMADIVIWRNSKDKSENKNPIIVVECKAENITICKIDYSNGFKYALQTGATFLVTINLKETRIFKVIKDEHREELEEIFNIPNADTVNNTTELSEFLRQSRSFARFMFLKPFCKHHYIIRKTIVDFYCAYINKWKEILGIPNADVVNNEKEI